jgi:hypothetical protein
MKVFISNKGIVESVSQNIIDASDSLNSALRVRPYAPSSFKYSKYVDDLDDKIKIFYRELKYIHNSLVKSERKYNNLFEKENNKIKTLPETILPDRNGLKDIF